MAADGAGGGAGRIQQHQGRGVLKIAHIAFDHLGSKPGARQILADARGAGRIDLHRASLARRAPPAAESCRPARRKDRSRVCPRHRPSSATGNVAAASCTHQSPSAKPGRSSTRVPSATRRDRPNRAWLSGCTAPSLFSVMSSGASWPCASAMARAMSSPYCALQRVHSQSGVLSRDAVLAGTHAFAFARDPPQHGIDQRT